MDIGVREFKQRLSELIERASKGEIIRVTDRGQPKALLCPLPGRGRLDQGIAEGWIRRGIDRPPARVQRVQASQRSDDVLAEDRE